jgi:hypothetical protein
MERINPTKGPEKAGERNASSSVPFEGGYMTDGETLFHIERTIVDDPRGGLLVELEDCATLELIVCSATSVAELGLRPVQPLVRNAR